MGNAKPEIARIQAEYSSVTFVESSAAEYEAPGTAEGKRMAGLIRWHLEQKPENDGAIFDVRFLSGLEDPETATLDAAIEHATGAWTQRWRYARLEKLRSATTTDEL